MEFDERNIFTIRNDNSMHGDDIRFDLVSRSFAH